MVRASVAGSVATRVILAVVLLARVGISDELLVEQKALVHKVVNRMKFYHSVRAVTLDDSFSEKVFFSTLQQIDPEKQYLIQTDINTLSATHLHAIDDALTSDGDIQFLMDANAVLVQRMADRVKFIEGLVRAGVVFDETEKVNINLWTLAIPTHEAEAESRWDKRFKRDILSAMALGVTQEEAARMVYRSYLRALDTQRKLSLDALVDDYLDNIGGEFSPFTRYESLVADANPTRPGNVGIALGVRPTGGVEITKLSRAGAKSKKLRVGDHIIGVGESQDSIEDVTTSSLQYVGSLLSGPAESQVWIRVIPAFSENASEIKLTRQPSKQISSPDSERATGAVVVMGDGENEIKLGVIAIPSFYIGEEVKLFGYVSNFSTRVDVEKILRDLMSQGVSGIVVDLRGNGGGLVNESVAVARLFLDGPLVGFKRAAAGGIVPLDSLGKKLYSGPVIVLVDGNSASASEIFAAAIQEYGRGPIVGDEHTFGKATMQQTMGIDGMATPGSDTAEIVGILAVTTHGLYSPSGKTHQGKGIFSDIVFSSAAEKELALSRTDPRPVLQFQDLSQTEITNLSLRDEEKLPENRLPQNKLEQLRASHAERMSEEIRLAGFTDLLKSYEEMLFREELYLAPDFAMPLAKLDSSVKEVLIQSGLRHGKGEAKTFGSDIYSGEVLSILVDWIRLQ